MHQVSVLKEASLHGVLDSSNCGPSDFFSKLLGRWNERGEPDKIKNESMIFNQMPGGGGAGLKTPVGMGTTQKIINNSDRQKQGPNTSLLIFYFLHRGLGAWVQCRLECFVLLFVPWYENTNANFLLSARQLEENQEKLHRNRVLLVSPTPRL